MSRLTQDSVGFHRRNRRFPRKDVNVEAQFSPVNIKLNAAQNLGNLHGFVRNLSPTGIYADLPSLYRVGTRFQVRMDLNGLSLALYAIVWRVDLKQDIDGPTTYGHGLKITTASEDTLMGIINYINS